MIPDFVDGHNLEHKGHRCTIEEVRARFGSGECREQLFARLQSWIERARRCGFKYVLVGGSFATAKEAPKDVDCTWFTLAGVSKDTVSPECAQLLDSSSSRERFGADFCHVPLSEHPNKWDETLDHWATQFGFDAKTMKDRGTLIVEII